MPEPPEPVTIDCGDLSARAINQAVRGGRGRGGGGHVAAAGGAA